MIEMLWVTNIIRPVDLVNILTRREMAPSFTYYQESEKYHSLNRTYPEQTVEIVIFCEHLKLQLPLTHAAVDKFG